MSIRPRQPPNGCISTSLDAVSTCMHGPTTMCRHLHPCVGKLAVLDVIMAESLAAGDRLVGGCCKPERKSLVPGKKPQPSSLLWAS